MSTDQRKKCPFCAEDILAEARKCRYCGEILDVVLMKEKEVSSSIKSNQVQNTSNPGLAAVLSFVVPGLGQIYKGNVGSGLMWLIGTALGYMFLVVPGIIIHIYCVLDAGEKEQSGLSLDENPKELLYCEPCERSFTNGDNNLCPSCKRPGSPRKR